MTTTTVKRLALGLAAAALSIGVTAGVNAGTQDQNTARPSRPFMGGPGGGGRGGPGGPMGMMPMNLRALDLSDAQRDQIKGIAESHRDEWKALADRARPAHEALRAAVSAGSVDETLIRAKSADVAAVEADMNVARARVAAEIVPLLTPDQKAKLNARLGPSGPRGRR